MALFKYTLNVNFENLTASRKRDGTSLSIDETGRGGNSLRFFTEPHPNFTVSLCPSLFLSNVVLRNITRAQMLFSHRNSNTVRIFGRMFHSRDQGHDRLNKQNTFNRIINSCPENIQTRIINSSHVRLKFTEHMPSALY